MTISAAGILYQAETGEILFLKRNQGATDAPGAWCFPGGHIEDGETAEQAARRESGEEIGFTPDGDLKLWTRRVAVDGPEPVDFTTFYKSVPEPFVPTLNDEHTAFAWAKPADGPIPLHPGVPVSLVRFTMTEMDAARAIAGGELTSPQIIAGFALWAIRITSTGAAVRQSLNENVWRSPDHWLTPEAIARVAALPVIVEHPNGTLDSNEYVTRVVGNVQYAYIADETGRQNEIGPDVWAIVRLYDKDTIDFLSENQWSTSPAVGFGKNDGSQTVTLEDGTEVFWESVPKLMCHIALVSAGVWDRNKGPTGIRSDAQQETVKMTDEEKAAAQAHGQSAAGNIDMLLSKLDSVMSRMDAMENERKDAARRDAQSRRDAEREEWMKKDAAACEKDDAEEKDEADKLKKDGAAEEEALEKARLARRDRMGRRDAADMPGLEKKPDDMPTRMDAQVASGMAALTAQNAEMAREIAALKASTGVLSTMTMSPNDSSYTMMADAQAAYDTSYQAFGKQAPPPMQSEQPLAYRRRLARGLQNHSKEWKGVDLGTLSDDALTIAEKYIRQDAVTASRNTDGLGDDVMIPRTTTNESGHRITEFHGRQTIFKRYASPSKRVTRFNEKRA